MANTIAIKSSDTAGATPVALAAGELALNRADDELYFLDESNNITSIVAIDCGEITQGWDIATAVFSQSFSVASQDITPTGLFFKPNGLAMYVVGGFGRTVNQYNLSSAWDISTATYAQNFSVASQDTAPFGLFFKPDGLRMYVIGSTGDDVNEYSLGSAWDVSTASYAQNFSLATEETSPASVFFKPDGAAMYVVGVGGDDVNQYSLGSAWDVSTASYVQKFSVVAQDSIPTGIFFKPDGLKMYIAGSDGADVNEYSLDTAWDISTAAYEKSFSVANQDSAPAAIFFKSDGLKMYLTAVIGDSVYEYNLSPS